MKVPMDSALLPFRVDIEISNACNLHCVHCMVETNVGRREMGIGAWTRCLERLREQGVLVVAFTGGEPMLHLHSMSLIERSVQLGLKPLLFTNCTCLNRRDAGRLSNLGVEVFTSLDGACAATHDSIRGVRGAFDKTVQAIRDLVRAGCKLSVETVVMRLNVMEITRIAVLMQSMGVESYCVSLLRFCGKALRNRNQLLPDARELEQSLRRLGVVRDQLSDSMAIAMPSPMCVSEPDHWDSTAEAPCAAGTLKLAIRSDGRIAPCLLLSEVTLGHANRDSLRSAAEKELCVAVLRAARTSGRCPAAALQASGSLQGGDLSFLQEKGAG